MLKKMWKGFCNLLGFNKNSKFVSDYISDTNIRSGIYMSAVIVALEIWLIIRQTHDEVVPLWQAGTDSSSVHGGWLLYFTSVFWLFMLVGIAMFTFALTYRRPTVSPKKRFISTAITSGLTLAFCIFGFFENYSTKSGFKYALSNTLLASLYIIAASLSIVIILSTFLEFRYKYETRAWNIVITALFAAMLFAFGVKVSYGDYVSANHKEIICFLTMALYGACMLIWRPYVSILLNVGLFLTFYLLIRDAPISTPREFPSEEGINAFIFGAQFKDGDLVNYITFIISLTMVCISIYHQRRNEAVKDEELEYIANYDELTGLYNFQHFVRQVNAENTGKKMILFFNLSNFKTINDQRGFEKGNQFLISAGNILLQAFGKDSYCCRQSDDHYLVYVDPTGIHGRINDIDQKMAHIDPVIELHVRVGGYQLKAEEDCRRGADKARYACATLNMDLVNHFREYDQDMHGAYHLMQYVIHSIDTAVKEEWVRPYYQPVVWSKDGTLCGVEALARWVDPERGLLPPGKFVPTLEKTKLIHKLDVRILESVCRDIRHCLDNNLPFVPVSINFSRLDFELMDVIGILEGLVSKYSVPKEYLHVEITESALADDEGFLTKCVSRLKERGYALWLDDFGSGYSSLNVLKDFDFDVMKIDMKFLSGFENNAKAQPLIESVISMAEKLGMRTLTEGVETASEREFLSNANCERLQGYLFGKALPFEELQAKIKSGELPVSDHLL